MKIHHKYYKHRTKPKMHDFVCKLKGKKIYLFIFIPPFIFIGSNSEQNNNFCTYNVNVVYALKIVTIFYLNELCITVSPRFKLSDYKFNSTRIYMINYFLCIQNYKVLTVHILVLLSRFMCREL